MTSKKPASGKSRSTSTAKGGNSSPKSSAKKESAKPAPAAKGGAKRVGTPAKTSAPPAPKPRGGSTKERPPAGKEKAAAPGAKGKPAPPSAKEKGAAPSAKDRAAAAAAVKGRPVAAGAKKVGATTAASTKRRTAKELLAAETPDAVAAAVSKLAPDSNGYVVINGRRLRIMSQSARPTPTRKVRSRTQAAVVAEPEEDAGKPVRTKLTKRELDQYRTLLLTERSQLVGDLAAMEDQALRSSGGNLSHMPIHMADLGTDTFDQDFMLGMAENERRRLREIDEALMRVENGTYGVCTMTGKPIPKQRLDAKPWAKNTIEAAREIEKGLIE